MWLPLAQTCQMVCTFHAEDNSSICDVMVNRLEENQKIFLNQHQHPAIRTLPSSKVTPLPIKSTGVSTPPHCPSFAAVAANPSVAVTESTMVSSGNKSHLKAMVKGT